jgi:hypothetical protein
MKKQIEKLIEEYMQKIACCDIDIKAMRSNKSEARRKPAPWSHSQVAYFEDINYEIEQKSIQRQCYVQFISDLEDLEPIA